MPENILNKLDHLIIMYLIKHVTNFFFSNFVHELIIDDSNSSIIFKYFQDRKLFWVVQEAKTFFLIFFFESYNKEEIFLKFCIWAYYWWQYSNEVFSESYFNRQNILRRQNIYVLLLKSCSNFAQISHKCIMDNSA